LAQGFLKLQAQDWLCLRVSGFEGLNLYCLMWQGQQEWLCLEKLAVYPLVQ
jgi:hypothetical protein